MTDTIPSQYGDLTEWTTADPQSLPAASAAMMTSVANALDGVLASYATAALLLADSPTNAGYYTADDAPGGFFYWSGSAWTALAGVPVVASTGVITAPVAGWQVSVSGIVYRYSGSAWVAVISGSNRIIPSAATNGSVNDLGVVTSTAQSLVRVRDAFPSGFVVFKLTFDVTMSGVSDVMFRLAVDATDAATAYDAQILRGINATTASARQLLNQNQGSLTDYTSASRHVGEAVFFGPNVADRTLVRVQSMGTDNPMTSTSSGVSEIGGQHRTATIYNSLTLLGTTGNVTVNRLSIEGVS